MRRRRNRKRMKFVIGNRFAAHVDPLPRMTSKAMGQFEAKVGDPGRQTFGGNDRQLNDFSAQRNHPIKNVKRRRNDKKAVKNRCLKKFG